jgi:mono/diheme cytochrome c family protein
MKTRIKIDSGKHRLGTFLFLCAADLSLAVSSALAGDAEAGRRLAYLRCAACHIVAKNQREEVAEAPPFAAIGRKFGFDADALVFALVGPHAKMNFSLNRREADDVSAYISTLSR